MHLIEQLEDIEVEAGTLLVTMDVESLYTNIAHDVGIKAVTYHLDKQTNSDHMSVEFLDLKLYIHQRKIRTSLFRKKTATNNILHFESFHPHHQKKAIPYSQFLRLKRNCSNHEDYKIHANELTTRLRARGYPKKIISQAYMRAKGRERSTLLTPSKKPKAEDTVRLITTYHNQWQDIHKILSTNWNILRSEPKLNPYIGTRPTIIARRAKNLKDHLTRSHFVQPATHTTGGHKIRGTFSCGECNICQYMANTDSLINPANERAYRLKQYINCKTKNVVYLIKCTCPKFYVGQTTQPLKKRIQQHLSTVNMAKKHFKQDKSLTSVAMHFLNFHNSYCKGIKIYGLEKIDTNIRGGNPIPLLLQKESRWIYELDTMTPTGLNEEWLFTGFYKQV
ncbi:peroxisomal membrane protein PMP34 isoform X2 [Engystomops pustulosus]|uniref:peroxisomal membrane protein PMP34 isoform X2 n=1 Tax=Engystomops pustulosus TaxID=76066 RepID=UPI003AFAFF8B